MSRSKTVLEMFEECAASMSGTFSRQEVLSWFRRHYPEVPESTLGAYIQALTSNAHNRERNAPWVGSQPPLFDRVEHGTYRVHQRAVGSTARTPASAGHNDNVVVRQAQEDWRWEGRVQARVVAHLAANGVEITRVADTGSREHGTDVEGIPAGSRMHVEVKGWPSDQYVDPARASEAKRTGAATQARVWFADGLMHVLKLRNSHPRDGVALALPDVPTYRRLLDSVRTPIEASHISVLWVDETGHVVLDGWGAQTSSA